MLLVILFNHMEMEIHHIVCIHGYICYTKSYVPTTYQNDSFGNRAPSSHNLYWKFLFILLYSIADNLDD